MLLIGERPSSPKMSILIQKRHPYSGNLYSEMSGDSKTFLYCGDPQGLGELVSALAICHTSQVVHIAHASLQHLGRVNSSRKSPVGFVEQLLSLVLVRQWIFYRDGIAAVLLCIGCQHLPFNCRSIGSDCS